MSIIDDVGDFFSDSVKNLIKIEKNLERDLVKNVFAPAKITKTTSIKTDGKKKIDDEIKTIKKILTTISDELDGSIKGKFSDKVKQAIKN